MIFHIGELNIRLRGIWNSNSKIVPLLGVINSVLILGLKVQAPNQKDQEENKIVNARNA